MGMTTGGGFGFRLEPSAIEPTGDPAWARASRSTRAQFWTEAGRVAAKAWDASRARGLDRHGKPLPPIHPLTRQARREDINPVTGKRPYSPMGRARPSAPPLTPAGPMSRVRSLLRWRPQAGKGVWFTWVYDRKTQHYWGEILARHARGFAQRFQGGWGHVPPRDVLGFSEAELSAVREHMARWWAARRPRVEPVAAVIVPERRRPGIAAQRREYGWDYGTPATHIDAGVRVATGRQVDGEIIWRSGLRQWAGKPKPPTPPAPPRPPALAVAVARPARLAIPRLPVLPPVTVARQVARVIGRALTQDDMLELALMARQAGTAEQADRLARAATGDEAARWRAVAILIRSGWRRRLGAA